MLHKESTPLSVLMLFFVEIITLLVVDTNHYYQHFLDNSDNRPRQCEVTSGNVRVFGSDVTDGTYSTR